MRSTRVAQASGVIRVIPGSILEERYGWDDVGRRLRDRRDTLILWGAAFLAIALAVAFQLLPFADAMASFARRRPS